MMDWEAKYWLRAETLRITIFVELRGLGWRYRVHPWNFDSHDNWTEPSYPTADAAKEAAEAWITARLVERAAMEGEGER
jgi:hypothetical protein